MNRLPLATDFARSRAVNEADPVSRARVENAWPGNRVSNREPLAALCTPAVEYLASTKGLHSSAKTMCTCAANL